MLHQYAPTIVTVVFLAGCAMPSTTERPIRVVTATNVPVATTTKWGSTPATREAPDGLPIFDTHMHYSHGAWVDYPLQDISKRLDRAGIAGGFVSSTPDDGTRMMQKHDPTRVVAVLRPYHGEAGTGNWTTTPGMWEYIEKRLSEQAYKAFGEFHLNSIEQANSEVVRKIAAEAVKRNMLLQIHSSETEIRAVLAHTPKARVMWAHMGMSASAAEVDALMREFPSLLADTALRDGSIAPGGLLDAAWRDVLIRHADRIMVGSDTWVPSRWGSYEEIIEGHRVYLRQLPRDVAEKIAWRTAQQVLKN